MLFHQNLSKIDGGEAEKLQKNVRAKEKKILVVFGLWQPCLGKDNHDTFVGMKLV